MLSSKGNKGFAFVNSLPPAMRGAPGGTISGRRPLPEVPWPDGINHSSSAIDNRPASRRPSRGLCSASRNMRKKLSGAFFGLLGNLANSDRNAHTALSRGHAVIHGHAPSRTYSDSRMPCRPNDTSEDLFGLYQYNMAAARTIFAFIARAACRFESVYSREGAVHILTA